MRPRLKVRPLLTSNTGFAEWGDIFNDDLMLAPGLISSLTIDTPGRNTNALRKQVYRRVDWSDS